MVSAEVIYWMHFTEGFVSCLLLFGVVKLIRWCYRLARRRSGDA